MRPLRRRKFCFFPFFTLVLGSHLMRFRLCVAPRAVGFGAGLALPRCGASLLFGVGQQRRSGVVVGSFWMMVGRCGVVGSDWLDFVVLGASCGWNRVGCELRSTLLVESLRGGVLRAEKVTSPVVFTVAFIKLK